MSKSQPKHLFICPCCNPALTLLGEKILVSRRILLLGTGSLLATAINHSAKSQSLPLNEPNNPLLANGNPFADIIYLNGIVITLNDQQPQAEAIAVKDGRILAVGDYATLKP